MHASKPLTPAKWSVWKLRKPAMVYIIAVYGVALFCAFPLVRPSESSLYRMTVLASVAAFCALFRRHVERARDILTKPSRPNLNLTSMTTFAGALCLPMTGALILVFAVYTLQWVVERDRYRGNLHRFTFNVATVVISCFVANRVADASLGIFAYTLCNAGLVAGVLAVTGNRTGLRTMIDPSRHLVSLGTLVVGACEVTLLRWHLALALCVIPILIGVQAFAMREQVSKTENIVDESAYILTRTAWTALATVHLAVCAQAVVVALAIDSMTDAVAAQCGRELRERLRDVDVIGRTEDGFLILVPGQALAVAEMIAMRICLRFAELGVLASAGSAATPMDDGNVSLDGLVVTATAQSILSSAHADT